jgi:hypothetical protein
MGVHTDVEAEAGSGIRDIWIYRNPAALRRTAYLDSGVVGRSALGQEAQPRVQPHHVVPLKPVPEHSQSYFRDALSLFTIQLRKRRKQM